MIIKEELHLLTHLLKQYKKQAERFKDKIDIICDVLMSDDDNELKLEKIRCVLAIYIACETHYGGVDDGSTKKA